ncbi:unnamed protein product [Rhizoctonia solani]|uniref:Fungal lipase-type domain-containing protein n=1 Tax=Rhizoctonia solani TaxID=456999 RepID=A0A8H3C4H2_9AGAM|nr:unnamed protein product [Rhizoctonia solani]
MDAQLPLGVNAPLGVPAGTLGDAKEKIATNHLYQLANLSFEELDEASPEEDSEDEFPYGPFGSSSRYNDLLEWTKVNAAHIKEAVKNRAYGGPDGSNIQWPNVFLCFLEAAAVYLRDSEKVREAAEEAKKGGDEGFKNAFQLLEESTNQIQEIVALWGMKFQVLCDLVEGSGSWSQNGPYCGAFYSEDPDAPFVGVVFKGTNIKNLNDVLTNLKFHAIQTEGILYNTHVSEGVHDGMFKAVGGKVAFNLIRQGLNDLCPNIANGNKDVVIHVAGHSLGGSYSNVCYTQFTVPNTLPPSSVLGDLYTFGCPRIGYKDFAEAMREHLGKHTGSAWRIANHKDPVTKVPPIPFTGNSQFNHVDAGYRLSKSKKPELIPSEIGTLTSGPFWLALSQHHATTYYAYLHKALSG